MNLAPDPTNASRGTPASGTGAVNWKIPYFRHDLGTPELQSLAKVLEGGTWATGRALAKERRPDASPPIRVKSDGTVF